MLNHEELAKEWANDSSIDRSDLMHTMYSHPMLHSKYLGFLMSYKVTLRKYTKKYQVQRMIRQRYYNGEMTKEELERHGWKQYLNKRPMNAERETLIDSSPEIQELEEKSLYTQTLIEAAESILKDINSRYYLFTNLVDYEKFQAGVGR